MIHFTIDRRNVVKQIRYMLRWDIANKKLTSTHPYLIHPLRCEADLLYAKYQQGVLYLSSDSHFEPMPYDAEAGVQWGRLKVMRLSKRMKARECIECQCSIEVDDVFCERTAHTIQGYINHEVYCLCYGCGIIHALTHPTTYQYA